jgi:hypothetical protein
MAGFRSPPARRGAGARRCASAAASAAVLALAAAPTAEPAAAQARSLAGAGAWNLSLGAAANTGEPMCVLSTYAEAGGRSVHIKYIRGAGALLVHVFKASWTVPRGADVPVELSIDDAPGWRAVAEGIAGGRASGVEFTVGRDVLPRFEALFRAGSAMFLRFPQGSEPTWRIDLAGSNSIAGRFVQCMKAINGEAGTQPHGGAPTQPHGAAPRPASPTQPHQDAVTGPERRT